MGGGGVAVGDEVGDGVAGGNGAVGNVVADAVAGNNVVVSLVGVVRDLVAASWR